MVLIPNKEHPKYASRSQQWSSKRNFALLLKKCSILKFKLSYHPQCKLKEIFTEQ